MQNSKQKAQQGKDLLSLCLAKAIDGALVIKQGPDWFEGFAREDETLEAKKQILKNGQKNVMDLDLQALLKILRYRESLADPVLEHYGFISPEDEFAAQGQKRQLRSLLDRLITDFRNQMEAHTRVADLEKPEIERLYGYEEALLDMEKLARIFKVVTHSDGISYYEKIRQLNQAPAKKKKKPILPILILLVAAIGIGVAVWFLTRPPKTAPEEKITGPTTGNVFYKPNNVEYKENEVSLEPEHVYYEGDQLVAKFLVLNGTKKTVSKVEFEKLIIRDQNKQVICAGKFDVLEGVTIDPYDYVEWTFRFPAELVSRTDADLSTLNYTYSVSYES